MNYTKKIITSVLIVVIAVLLAVATIHTSSAYAQDGECTFYVSSIERDGSKISLHPSTCTAADEQLLPNSVSLRYKINLYAAVDTVNYDSLEIMGSEERVVQMEKVVTDSDLGIYHYEATTPTIDNSYWATSFVEGSVYVLATTLVNNVQGSTAMLLDCDTSECELYVKYVESYTHTSTGTTVVDTPTVVVDTPVVDTPVVDTPVADTADTEVKRNKRASQGSGAIRPGYLTCRVAGRKNCGSVNTDVWQTIGLYIGM